MQTVGLVASIALILLGLVVAYSGHRLFKGLVALFGALLLGAGSFMLGLWIGGIVGGPLGIIVAVVMGLIGAVTGALLATGLAMFVLVIAFAMFSWSIGLTIGGAIGLDGLSLYALALVIAVIGAVTFMALSRTMLRLATSILGAYLVAWGAFSMMSDPIGIGARVATIIAVVLFILVATTGFIAQSGEKGDRHDKGNGGKKRRGQKGKRDR